MSLFEVQLAIGGITAVLVQGFKTIPFIKNNSWLAIPGSVIVGMLVTSLYASAQASHFVFTWSVVLIGLTVGLIAGGFYSATSSASTKYQAYKARKLASKAQ